MLGKTRASWVAGVWSVALLVSATDGIAAARSDAPTVSARLTVPRVSAAPKLEDFLAMRPDSTAAREMSKVEGFIQRDPKDGDPASQKTEVYVGYTQKDLYIAWVCFDQEPGKIRARLGRRENIGDDDNVRVYLDTFNDQRRSYVFAVNPLGVQMDATYSEGNGHDRSFDTVWNSSGKVTKEGYVALLEIPFKSLRFPSTAEQTWGFIFLREIPRNNESSYWPKVTHKIQGQLNQEEHAGGLKAISPGRNIQFIPYGVFQAFRALDQRGPGNPFFTGAHAHGRFGLDTKMVIKDSFVLDITANPDFSQVESDDPQQTVNQRFEVYFPEKRPFFLENSNYFDTPWPLVFTRRIADPKFGARLTGKKGPWALGFFTMDDTSPGKIVPPGDVMRDKRAFYNILRVNYELGKQSSVGMIYTDRELPCSKCTSSASSGETNFNRVGGVDYRWKIAKNWQANGQAVGSDTKFLDGSRTTGWAIQNWAEYSSRKMEFNTLFQDTGGGFLTRPGFFIRPDFRRFSNFWNYRFRPEGKHLISHGPNVFQLNTWDHNGTALDKFLNANYVWVFKGQTDFGFFANTGTETLRPVDFSSLTANRVYDRGHHGMFFETAFFKQVSINGEFGWGTSTLFDPRVGPPVSARNQFANLFGTVRPLNKLTIENSYLLERLAQLGTHRNLFNNHIIRSKWNYQITKELSVRVIGTYNAVLSNPALTTVQTTKSANADFLITWLLHPGTAVYVGYNTNMQNLDRSLGFDPDGNLLRTRSRFLNDGRQIFVKVSYLLRY